MNTAQLKTFVSYSPNTGVFTRIANRTRKDLIGTVCGSTNANGYVYINVQRKVYLAHRLVFLYVTGKWPTVHVDHINGVRTDNRWTNLREATRSQNNMNSAPKRQGLKGVEIISGRNKKFMARICTDGVRRCLGYYYTEAEAHAAYWEAAKKHHREFARAK